LSKKKNNNNNNNVFLFRFFVDQKTLVFCYQRIHLLHAKITPWWCNSTYL